MFFVKQPWRWIFSHFLNWFEWKQEALIFCYSPYEWYFSNVKWIFFKKHEYQNVVSRNAVIVPTSLKPQSLIWRTPGPHSFGEIVQHHKHECASFDRQINTVRSRNRYPPTYKGKNRTQNVRSREGVVQSKGKITPSTLLLARPLIEGALMWNALTVQIQPLRSHR